MREWLLATPTPSWVWLLIGAACVIQLVFDDLVQGGFGVGALALAAASVVAAALFLGRLAPSSHRQSGNFVVSLSVALAVGRNAVPSDTTWSMDSAKQMLVSVAVAVSLTYIIAQWLSRCDRRRTSAPR